MAPKKKEKVLSKKAQERLAKAEAEKKAKQITEGDASKQAKHVVLSQAVITGNLQSRADSRDLKIGQFSVTTFGKTLVGSWVLFLRSW